MTFPDTWEEFEKSYGFTDNEEVYTNGARLIPSFRVKQWLDHLPYVQATLYGYNIEHLVLIARVLQKEDLPPERVVEALTDIGRIVAIVRDEFEETLRKSVEHIYCDSDFPLPEPWKEGDE